MALLRAALLFMFLAVPARAAEITVFAAASLKTALDQIAEDWQAETGHSVVIAYGGSAALAKQIIEAAPADIFISAAPDWMDAVEAQGMIRPGTRRDLLGNRLVLIGQGPKAAPMVLDETTNLLALLSGGRMAMGLIEAVPAGQYGKEALISLGLWDQVKDHLAQSENVRIALQMVALGEAPLGIVYATDALADAGAVRVIATFPKSSHRPIRYPGAVIASSKVPEAEAFFAYLASPAATAVFEAQGFIALADQ
jgi:molybdate transport system substrate-binding protein